MAEEKSEYIVIEKHGGWENATVVTDDDGTNKVYVTLDEALAEADNCQDGIVVGDEMYTDDAQKLMRDIDEELNIVNQVYESERINILRTRLKEYL